MPTPSPIMVVMLSTNNRHRGDVSDDPDQRERDRDGQHPDHERQQCRHQRAEGQHQHEEGEGEQRLLAPLAVVGDDGADVEVQRRPAGHPCLVGRSVRCPRQRLAHGPPHRGTSVAWCRRCDIERR
jgi:hypothetical protein